MKQYSPCQDRPVFDIYHKLTAAILTDSSVSKNKLPLYNFSYVFHIVEINVKKILLKRVKNMPKNPIYWKITCHKRLIEFKITFIPTVLL